MARYSEKLDRYVNLYNVKDGDCLDCECPLCGKGTDPSDSDHACRVCGKVFHRSCCESNGKYSEFDLSMMDRAFTNVGWSCVECDDVSQSTLSAQDHMKICNLFNEFDNDDNGSITLEEYLKTRERAFERDLTEHERKQEERNFREMDRDSSGEIELPEFLAHEAVRYLEQKTKEELVELLTPLEKKSARTIFNMLDRNKDGGIDMWETLGRGGVASWYSLTQRLKELHTYEDNVKAKQGKLGLREKKISVVGQHLIPKALSVRSCDENHDGVVSWPEFLRGHALDIILARPNKAADREVKLAQFRN